MDGVGTYQDIGTGLEFIELWKLHFSGITVHVLKRVCG